MSIFDILLKRTDEQRRLAAEAAFAKLEETDRGAIIAALSSGYDLTVADKIKTVRTETESEFLEKRFPDLYKQQLEKEHPELASDPLRREIAQMRKELADSKENERRAKMYAAAVQELGDFAVKGLVDPGKYIGADEAETRALAAEQKQRLEAYVSEAAKAAATNEAARFTTGKPPAAGAPNGENPWNPATVNLTRQAEILDRDPAQAAALKAAAANATA